MAEFSLGLTKTAVEGTLSLVKSAVEDEKKLKEKVHNDLVFISDEFEMMRSFLRVANNNNNKNDDQQQQVVRLTWVRQLRTLAFDVEDCVEYVVHLDLDKPSRWGWLQRLWHTVNCRAPQLPLDEAVAEIKQLKARVEDVSQRNARYNLTLHHGSNNKQQQPVTVMPLLAEEPPYPSAAAFHALRDAWKATGKWSSNMCNLQQELLLACEGDHDLRVISVWGSTSSSRGGAADHLGTASVFRKAYCDPQICEKFRSRAWVKVTHPFNHDDFIKSLVTQLCATSHQGNAEFTEGNLMRAKKAMMEQMRRQRYLVVLEDVLTVAEWDVIKMFLPDSKKGSRILMSTPQLGIALHCTGEPYQVSELRNFSDDNQFLCAFLQNKKAPTEMGKFRHRGVISVWGADDDDKSKLVDILYKGIINGWFKGFHGVFYANKSDHVGMLCKGLMADSLGIRRHSWVDVPDPFDLRVFAQRLFLNCHSDDIGASTITKGGKIRESEADLIQRCREFLFEGEYLYEQEQCLVVINCLRSTDDWELIKSKFLFGPIRGCILVVTNEETVAMHCVKDHQKYQVFNVKDLKADTSISRLINMGSWHYGIRGKKGRLLSDRRNDALEWTSKFKNVGGNNQDEGKDEEEFGVFTVSESEEDNIDLQGILRHAYYGAFPQIKRRSWVDVPCDVTDFAWRLLLDFYSDDPQAKEAVAVGLMEGTIIDPIEKCREILRNEKCLVVINDLQWFPTGSGWDSDWDLIKDTFFSDSEPIQNIIIVNSRPPNRRFSKAKVLPLGNQEGFMDTFYKEYYRHPERCQKALEWIAPIGRNAEFSAILSKSDLLVVSVWGIAGVGKSSLVRAVYYEQMLRSAGPYHYQAFGWVDVPSPFNLSEFAWRLLLDLYSDDPQAKQTAAISSMTEEGQDPILECCKILREMTCLIVIDGLCSMQEWDLIKATLLSNETSDRRTHIIVITTEQKVAKHCVENDKHAVVIRRLEADTALHLHEKMTSSEGRLLTPQEAERSKSIVSKCGGLPKVITAVAGGYRPWLENLLSDNFMGTLETDPSFRALRPLFSWMQSYFDACSDSLKPCIFYLSIFPPAEKKNIRRRRLLCRWIAEGYCRDTSDGKTCEENGEDYISELVDLSIIQWSARSTSYQLFDELVMVGEQRKMSKQVFCEINGFFHEYIISRPMEDNLVFALEKDCSLNSTRGGQHLTIRSTWDRRDRIVYESIDFSRLRSLTIFGKWESFFISNSKNVNMMRLLRVLDLEDATHVENKDLEQIAKLLPRLKFLSLRGHKKVNCLPISMGGLRQLQTLDIRGTSIVTLPLFITKLQKLRYIRAGTVTSEAWDWDWEEGDVVLVDATSVEAVTNLPPSPAATATTPNEGGTESTAPVVAQVAAGSPVLPSAQECDVVSADGEEEADRASSLAQAATNLAPTSAAATPEEGGMDTTTPALPSVSCNNRPPTPNNNLVCSFLSKLCRRGDGLDNNGPAAGVSVPADIGKLGVLHTLGVVKVNARCSKDMAIFQELEKLTQLRKLGVSGINKGNIHVFCEAISHHAHLKSLSVEVDKDDDLDDNIPGPPKTVKRLKLYGHVNKLLPIWIGQLEDNLEKLKLDLTIEKPEELPALNRDLMEYVMGHVRIRPIQHGDLLLQGWGWGFARVVEIECSSVLHIKFDGEQNAEVLKVHFSAGSESSSLRFSGLSHLWNLKEVWLKGYTEAHKQYMQQQIDEMNCLLERPVLKLVQPRLS